MAEVPTDSPTLSVCPWCSASLAPDTAVCPSCGAILTGDDKPDLPGLTAIDANALRPKPPAQRNRLLSWISGEYPEDVPTESDAQAIAPPQPDVRREILRLELEAEVANLQAEADAAISEAAAEGRTVEIPEGLQPLLSSETLEEATEGLPEVAAGPDAAPAVPPDAPEPEDAPPP
jgi:hypothetical protein